MADSGPKLTPMMERYMEVKQAHPGTLLLFRMGDFYELFFEDAEVAAKILGLNLTSRDKNSPQPVPMAGFPYHALEGYLQKLIRAGLRAAICDQVEDPRKAKGMVRREVTQVVTPGTLTDDALLDPRESNFLAALCLQGGTAGLSWLELSTGRFYAADLEPEQLRDELARIAPAECLLPEGFNVDQAVGQFWQPAGMVETRRPAWCWTADDCRRTLLEHFRTRTLEGFDFEDDHTPGITAAGALLEYIHETQKTALPHITQLEPWRRNTYLVLDDATRRSLELTRTIRDGSREGSLLGVIDGTVTPMGARLLSDWLSSPLTQTAAIEFRLDAVEELTRDPMFCRDLQAKLKGTWDLQRLATRLSTGRASPRDLSCVARTLASLPDLKSLLSGCRSKLLLRLHEELDLCEDVRSAIEEILVDEPPINVAEGNVIRPGFHPQLDELRDLARGGKEWIAAYQAGESERTGIPNLKVGFNKVFGYYLEVTAAHAAKVPENYIRKQTLKNQERYITPELKEYEEKVLRAEERAGELEQDLFETLREQTAAEVNRLQRSAAVLAAVDVLTSLAVLAVRQRYCRPEVTEEPVLDIREGRHPVLDCLQPSGEFVPNDVRLGPEAGRVQIITGPNMAGKSTYIRQAALLTVMAQMGSFVPAGEARIGVADRIFARVGASDELGRGQSTFMVEMTETARILNRATAASLVILDEIGRGTSTYDGISLAWSVTEYLHDVARCRTLFATHYHELTDLVRTLPHARNWNVAVREDDDDVIFLHRIVEGAAGKSYGIHVARLAGVPDMVIARARVILDQLEENHLDDSGKTKVPPRMTTRQERRQLSLFGQDEHPLLQELSDLELDDMTPIAALVKLHELRTKLKGGGAKPAANSRPAPQPPESARLLTGPETTHSADHQPGD
ncbi:MAG: DNA mismatch repair protein MutS [Planctomycetaceae bacterium]|nr:DNA mismatch repair protein MutS [Planctomycetaceae bacterium]